MNADQFNAFMQTFRNGMAALIPEAPAAHAPVPKIAVKIPTFREAPKENIIIWMLQVQNLFNDQGIVNKATRIYYAATGFEDAVLHWYLNRIALAGEEVAFDTWNNFADALRLTFQPPNYQQCVR